MQPPIGHCLWKACSGPIFSHDHHVAQAVGEGSLSVDQVAGDQKRSPAWAAWLADDYERL